MTRRQLRWNIKTASERAGIDDGSWSAWERGSLPRDLGSVARKIHAATGVDMGWLVFGSTGPDLRNQQSPWIVPETDNVARRRLGPVVAYVTTPEYLAS